MNYELAKQLKDAGFPQNHSKIGSECYFDDDQNQIRTYNPEVHNIASSGAIYIPTLSELIEACMDFYSPAHFEMGGWNTWWAILRNENNTEAIVPVQTGQTPEETVARLWLELTSDLKNNIYERIK